MSKQLDSIPNSRPDGLARKEPEKQESAVKRSPKPRTTSVEPEDEVPLGVMVPASVKHALNIRAATEKTTNRVLILKALRELGLEVADIDLTDRRK